MTGALKAVVLSGRSIVVMSGTDRIKFLQGLATNDLRQLAPERAMYAGFLTGQGKLICDFFVIQDGERLLIDIATAQVENLFKRLTAFKLRAQVEFSEPTPPLAVAAVWGEGAAARLGLEPAEGTAGKSAVAGARYAFVDPRFAALGARIIYPADLSIDAELAQLGFTSASTPEYDAHRLALGIADTAEIGGETCYPLEANFEMLHGVDFKKGCYVGQELTARMKLKSQLRKRVLPVTGTAPLPPAGTLVMTGQTELGPLIATSDTQGLALLRLDRLANAQEGTIRAQEVPLSIHWPSWIPH
jgi:tRNA-modifying protein YgfZ